MSNTDLQFRSPENDWQKNEKDTIEKRSEFHANEKIMYKS